MIGVGVLEVAHFHAHGFAHAQAGVVDEGQHHFQPRQAHRRQHGGHLLAVQHQRQGLRRGDAQLLEHRPALDPEQLAVETAQGALGHLHGRAAKVLLLPQEQVIAAHLVFRGAGRIPLQVIGETPEITNVLLFGGGPVIFELDKVGEFCDGWIWIVNHKAASVPVDAVTRSPPNKKSTTT